MTRQPSPPLRPRFATSGTSGDEPPAPASCPPLCPQLLRPIGTPDPTRARALLLPADPSRPGQIIPVALSSSTISDVIGGGLLQEVDCTDATMPAHVVYQDADRDTKELPRNDRAWRLATCLNWPHVHHRISLRGDALIVGLDHTGQDIDVPDEVATVAFPAPLSGRRLG